MTQASRSEPLPGNVASGWSEELPRVTRTGVPSSDCDLKWGGPGRTEGAQLGAPTATEGEAPCGHTKSSEGSSPALSSAVLQDFLQPWKCSVTHDHLVLNRSFETPHNPSFLQRHGGGRTSVRGWITLPHTAERRTCSVSAGMRGNRTPPHSWTNGKDAPR